MTGVVLDTNIVLDLWLFSDPKFVPLQQDLDTGALQWQATRPMRDPLAGRVARHRHGASHAASAHSPAAPR